MVFYQCGVDILETDKLGRLGVSSAGVRNATAASWSDATPMGSRWFAAWGGYSPDIWHIVEACNTFPVRTTCGAEACGIVVNWSGRIRPCRN